jgi:hypothetical protein
MLLLLHREDGMEVEQLDRLKETVIMEVEEVLPM